MSSRFLIHVTTNWCGMDQEYAAIAEQESDLWDLAGQLAYDNFSEFNCLEEVLSELFPEVEDEEYSDEQRDEAAEVEGDYYGWIIEEFERPDEEFEWYELVYNCDEK
jgi:hypothetical protein